MDHTELGRFLRTCRSQVRPSDVGLSDGGRRRVPGLRRDEVARLAGMSVDYYIELEQGRGQSPSAQILTALSRALRLDPDKTAYLQHLIGHQVPLGADPGLIQQALLQLLGRLEDTPAMIITDLHQMLVQNRMSQALIGPFPTGHGLEANFVHRWFALPETRDLFPAEERLRQSRVLVWDLRAAVARRGTDRTCTELLARLRTFPEFAELWDMHEVAVPGAEHKRIVNPALGVIEVTRNSFYTADAAQRLLWMVPHDADVLDRLRLLNIERTWSARRQEARDAAPAPTPAT